MDEGEKLDLQVNRRAFLAQAALGSLGMAPLLHGEVLGAAPKAGQLIKGKDDRLVVLVENPAVFETPLDLLGQHPITPTDLLFVRNNQQPAKLATLEPVPLADWKIELTGLIDRPLTIAASDLAKLKQVEIEMVLQCSGNGRSLFAQAVKTAGTQWGRGGIANVRFAGVPLSALLPHYRVKVKPEARFLTAEGQDEPAQGKEDFEHSIPLADALQHSFFAFRLNGPPLPAIHGGPVRLVTPGYYATMHVKWLSRLRFDKGESTNYNHLPRYRTPNAPIKPGSKIAYTLENSTPTWRMTIGTIITNPLPGAKLPTGKLQVQGASFNDGAARIDSVLVSLDRGQSWRRAAIDAPKSPYAWYRWTLETRVQSGKQSIWAYAIDALGRSQPLDGTIAWNPSGYEWNGVEKVDFSIE